MTSSRYYSGAKFEKLTLVEKIPSEKHKKNTKWRCRCSCGNEIIVLQSNLKRQKGCKRCAKRTHGMAEAPLYETWSHMKRRCLCVTDQNYHSYGGRGITVCEEWMDFEPFMEWAYEVGYSEKLTLDRIDNNAGYSPDNCRWVDRKTQSNNRRNSIIITANGKTLPCAEWARLSGIPRNTIRGRLIIGWTPEDAVTIPVLKREIKNVITR